ncbi:AraC family transcriptional regulator [Paenibacillus swuensis]|uniref:AraC family transcriptional regulator n=1 Tax=Paenibacillus swuensis TaxID=1178515 RepID=A0A172TFR6_9BACL|nr:response regulator [Paenibacillus swuensis]ANE45776.1 AraC family transcriptional regulator [Paenibacillus swuensis]
MYKVLLADDEMLDLEGMKAFVPWKELGMEVVGGVTNGFAACKVLETEKIDILVTDVRMPNMTGLELAGKALERWKDIKIIFVSGYQDFHYAKQALSLNASGYVLKPMDDQELIDSLAKVRNALDEERKREAAFGQIMPLARNEAMLRIPEGDIRQSYGDSELLPAGKHTKNWKLIHNIVDDLRERLQDNVTLRDVAKEYSFSPNYLGQLFKVETGKHFSEYLIALRLEKACELLIDTNLKIYEVADRVGYRYLPYFSRQFKEAYGMTPLEYRRQ